MKKVFLGRKESKGFEKWLRRGSGRKYHKRAFVFLHTGVSLNLSKNPLCSVDAVTANMFMKMLVSFRGAHIRLFPSKDQIVAILKSPFLKNNNEIYWDISRQTIPVYLHLATVLG